MWLRWSLDFHLLLVARPHQEGCKDIKEFIWRIYVSYRLLNSVTRSFEFPILRFTDSIEELGDYNGSIYLSPYMQDLDIINFSFAKATKKN